MSLLRLSSYASSSTTTTHGYPKSPSSPASSPPSQAFPPSTSPSDRPVKPSDILVNRSHQVKRITKGLAEYFAGLATAHHSHSLTLSALSQPAKTPIPTPLAEASLFLPLSHPAGWSNVLHEAKETNLRVAQAHADFATRVTKEVVGPLTKMRVEMKTHISIMEKEVNKLIDAVQRERDITAPLLSRLSAILALSSPIPPTSDPVLLRAQIESQLAKQLEKENDLLECVKTWTQKCEEKERGVWEGIKEVWGVWEGVSSATHLNAQQHSMFLSAAVDSIEPSAEWEHFLKLNHAVLPETPARTLLDVLFEGKGDERTGVVREGLLERQSSWIKSWKPAYFLLTPSGHLHVYPPPPTPSPSSSLPFSPALPSSTSAPSSPISLSAPPPCSPSSLPPLTPSATHLLLHSTPLLSLQLSACVLGPMPTPPEDGEGALSSSASAKEKKKGGLEPVFTLIEGKGNGTKHVIRCGVSGGGEGGAGGGEGDGWEEMGKWVGAIGPFCATPALAAAGTPPVTPSSAVPAKDSLLSPPPPALPPRDALSASSSSSSLPSGDSTARTVPLGASPALPSLPPRTPSSISATPPALPSRGDDIRSSLVISEDSFDPSRSSVLYNDEFEAEDEEGSTERRMLSGLGVLDGGSGGGEGGFVEVEQEGPPVPPRDYEESGEDTVDEDEEDDDAGDLGRSIRPSSASASRSNSIHHLPIVPSLPATTTGLPRSQSGSVRSLAAAWEVQQSPPAVSSPRSFGVASPPPLPPLMMAASSPAIEALDAAPEVEEPPRDEPLASSPSSPSSRSIKLDDSFPSPPSPSSPSFVDASLTSVSRPSTPPPILRDGAEEEGETVTEPTTPTTPSAGKKGKKKRKSKGGASGVGKPTERPLPLPSVDPEHADLGLPSPLSTAFDLEGELREVEVEVEREEEVEKGEEGAGEDEKRKE